MSEEEIIWLDENSPHDPLAEAIYSELHFQRYKEYLKLGKKLRKSKHLELFANEIQIRFELDGKFLKIEYFLTNNRIYRDFADINLKPKYLENTVDEQLLLQIAEAETNALLYKTDGEFILYNQPAVGFFKPVKLGNRYQRIIDSIRKIYMHRFHRPH